MIYAKHIGDFTFDRMPIVWELAITAHWTGELLMLFRITLKFLVNNQQEGSGRPLHVMS